ncbi:hypothetical protein [Luteitalea sp.]|jgi:hypothetical protein|uniref:hypothetical protein n=1 Tax=Luteitalea sp. TaxID=2004800 RepID=UPI0037CC20D5
MNPHISIDTQRPFERASHLASHTRTCLATFLLLACSLLTITERAAAATLSAPSCSAFDVNETIAIAKTGDTVLVPAGTCTWGAGGNYVSLDKVITLQGAGRGVTIIEMASTAGSWTNGTIRLYWPGTVRGFTIKTSTGASGTAIGAYWTDGFRVTDIEYIDRSSSNSGYFLYTDVYGVVDNNSITGNRGDMEMIFARGPANDPIKSWQTPHSMGGAANLFVENNEFFGLGYVIDCNANSRCVLRYNTIHGPSKIDGHGKASNSPGRGVRHMEIYNNRWTNTGAYWTAIELRGGGGRVFNNVASGGWFYLTEYGAMAAWPNFGSVCQCPANYPIDDQIGVGSDPKTAAAEPMYLWNNIKNGSAWTLDLASTSNCTATCGTFAITDIVKPGRDYFVSASKPAAISGYQPYTCPHPVVGPGSCGAAAGRDGYTVGLPAPTPPTPPTGLRVVP